MGRKIRFQGRELSASSDRLRPSQYQAEVKLAAEVGTARAAGQIIEGQVEGDDLLELDLGDGVVLWTTVDRYLEDTQGAPLSKRSRKPQELPLVFPSRSGATTRGLGAWVLEGLKVIGIDPLGAATDMAAGLITDAVAKRIEAKLGPPAEGNRPGPGLYHFDGTHLHGDPLEESDLSTNRPLLLFLHGTFSSTNGSFSDLREHHGDGAWKRLKDTYGDSRILGLDHRTLTESPLENAVRLLQALPANAELHVVSHSRGGMVGDLLCAGDHPESPVFDDDVLDAFQDGGREEDVQALRLLNELLEAKRPNVTRFVRVACPARGTTLMDGRLDLWLSCVINVLKFAGLESSDLFSVASDLLIAVAKNRTEPDELPGLAAMLPTSPLVHLLNTHPRVSADLSIVAGDFDGRGVLGRLGGFIADRFYGADHDFVVPTDSMTQGIRREKPTRMLRLDGPEVTHLTYFRRAESANPLAEALLEKADAGAGFAELPMRGKKAEPEPAVFDANKATVYVLPGIMGTELRAGDNTIWVDLSDLAKGRLAKLSVDADNVEPAGLHDKSYDDAVKYFGDRFNAIPFPYDWRHSIEEAGRALGATIRETLRASDKPVYLLAHSMGGLVSRAMMRQHPDVWDDIVGRGGRLVMAGTPNAGSFTAVRVLLGKGKMIKGLSLLDLKHSKRGLLEIVSDFPGFLELLPSSGSGESEHDDDHFLLETWRRYERIDGKGWALPNGNRLRSAKRVVQDVTQDLPHPGNVKYVAGVGKKTASGVRVDGDRIRITASRRGDGTVLWDGGIPREIDVWYAPSQHGGLLSLKSAFPAYEELLTTGSTSRLPKTEPVARSQDVEPIFIDEEEEAQHFPTEDELLLELLPSDPEVNREDRLIDISVRHGDVRYAQYPVLLGHYRDDGIFSAEKALDQSLDERLSQRWSLGDYPEDLETAAIFFERKDEPRDEREEIASPRSGAIVVGLGTIGELHTGGLIATLDQGLRGFASRASERSLRNHPNGLAITALLVGSGEGGVGVDEAVRCLLTAARLANRKIAESNETREGRAPKHHTEQICRIEIVEIYEDRAVRILQTLQRLAVESDFSGRLLVQPHLQRAEGGYRRMVFETQDAWWTRLTIEKIAGDKDPSETKGFKFTALADRARSDEREVDIQQGLIDDLLRNALTTGSDSLCERQALFELLLPNAYKRAAAEERNVVLVVDEKAASLPWELFLDRARDRGRGTGPTDSGLLRSLRESNPPPAAHPSELKALVFGDPTPTDDPDYPLLDGARDEALAVRERLREFGWDTRNSRIRDTHDMAASELLCELFGDDYRVLHFSGHGTFDACDRQRSGMIIGGAAGDTVEERDASRQLLTPGEVAQMRMTPELVFLNCCFLGKVDDPDKKRVRPTDRHLLAGNLAAQFIKMGVKAVVAAGWEVDDLAAKVFADVFYSQLLGGRDFGQAVTEARRAAYRAAPASNTWAAYQCYGSPQFRLIAGRSDGGSSREQPPYVDPMEPIIELDNVVSRAKRAGDDGKASCKGWLEDIEDRLPQSFRSRADVKEALAAAHGELGDFDEAIKLYTEALKLDQGGSKVSIRAIEQRANLRARQAASGAGSLSGLRESITDLRSLVRIGETGERLSLLASGYKSRLMVARSPARRDLLEMTKNYRQAYVREPENLYPASNALLGSVLLRPEGWPTVDEEMEFPWWQPEEFDRELSSAERIAQQKDREATSFWDRVYVPDLTFVRALHEVSASPSAKRKKELHDELVGRYRQLFSTLTGSVRQWDSVLKQLRFAQTIAEALELPAADWIREVEEAIAKIPN